MYQHLQNVGKIIDNFSCYIATVLDSEIALRAKEGDAVTITLASGNEYNAEIAYIKEQENKKALIVLKVKTLTEELIQYRKISFNITWWSSSGLKVPNSSILEDENGLKYVVRKKMGVNQKAIVKVIKKNDKFSTIKIYSKEELEQLGVDAENYLKITKYDTILLYPTKEIN